MAEFQVLYWKDIPAQVRAYEGRKRKSIQLPDRFQLAIDQRAMVEGLAGTDAYLEHWEWTEKQERSGSADTVLNDVVRELLEKHK
jgi:hypothetical protein